MRSNESIPHQATGGEWRPRCVPPAVVRPVALDPSGLTGPTRGRARGPDWRRVGPGLYVPASTAWSVEQRVAEVAARLPPGGLITGWAALRLQGARYFEGADRDGRPCPVPVLLPHASRLRDPRIHVTRTRRPLPGAVVVNGVPCAPAELALLAELRRRRDRRRAGVAVDMALAAGIVRLDLLRTLAARSSLGDVAAYALARACGECRSPKESEMLQVWEAAGLPRPLMNREVLDVYGRLLAIVDLLDVWAGVCGEYNGATHRSTRQLSRDEQRRAALRAVGLETFAIVAGDSPSVQVARMRAARERALWVPEHDRRWLVGRTVLD